MYFNNIRELIVEIINIFKRRAFFYSVKYVLWVYIDKIRGYDFVKNAGFDKTGLDDEYATVYQATRDTKFLKKVLKDIGITNEDSIIDLGCGKAYTLFFFSKFSFKKIAGVELSNYLYSIAKNNMDKLGDKRCFLYHISASSFTEFDEYNIIYMFNPFRSDIMKKVMENLRESICRNPRRVIIIYKIPAEHDTIIGTGCFKLLKSIPGKTDLYNVYISE